MNENQQNKWQSLIETKRFDELSDAEKEWVNSISSETSYLKERTILIQSKELIEAVEPRPLVLSDSRTRVVPLYLPFIAAAASFVLAFLLFRTSGMESTEKDSPTSVLVADTVFVEKTITDTILETQTKYVYIDRSEKAPIVQQTTSGCASQPVKLTSQSAFETDLSDAALSNKGISARKDKSLDFVVNWFENQR